MPRIRSEAARDQLLDRALESFLRCHRQGEAPSLEEYKARHPDLATQLEEVLPGLIFLEDAKRQAKALGAADSAADGKDAGAAPQLVRLGEYRILRELGRGGMGIVYEAEQESLGRRVAIKILPSNSVLDPKRLERFRREARAAAALQHPNLVPVHGVGVHEGLHYFVMQLVPGQGLDQIIADIRRLRAVNPAPAALAASSSGDVAMGATAALLLADAHCGVTPGKSPHPYFRNAAALVRQAADALSYAHEHGVLHRDVKPANLLLDGSAKVWVADFGLAKAEGADDVTRSGEVVGTLAYMAPERFRGQTGPLSDVYGLGLTLYELLTLRPAFAEAERSHLMRRILTEEPIPPRRIDPEIPRDLETIALKATAKEPGRRYASAGELRDDLGRFLDNKPILARRTGVSERTLLWCRRNPHVAWVSTVSVTLVVLLAATASTGSLAWYNRAPEAPAANRPAPPVEPDPAAAELLEPIKNLAIGAGAANAIDVDAKDTDGDSTIDIVCANHYSNNIAAFHRQRDGSFARGLLVPTGSRPVQLVLADLDLDGRTDAITVNRESRDVTVLWNEKPGGLAPAAPQTLAFAPFGLLAQDLDADKDPDVVVAGGGHEIQVLRNEGARKFVLEANIAVGLRPSTLTAADLDGDGHQDLAVVSFSSNSVQLLWSVAGRAFAAGETLPTGTGSMACAAQDFDGDDDFDLAVTSYEAGEIWMLHNEGNRRFERGRRLATGRGVFAILGADLDANATVDLAVACELSQDVGVFLGKGKGSFGNPARLEAGGAACALTSADLDADGDIDLATANGMNDSLGVLRNRTSARKAIPLMR